MSHRPVILVADDDPDIINQMKVVFKPMRDQVDLQFASNGRQAIDTCVKAHPNLLLLDHNMPGIDGFTACQMIRNMNPDHHMDIWFITGMVSEDDMPLAMEAGADCLINKPINIPQLRHMIQRHLFLDDGADEDDQDFQFVDIHDEDAA